MSPSVPTTEVPATWNQSFARSVQDQRERLKRLIHQQRERFAELDEQLLQRAQDAADQLQQLAGTDASPEHAIAIRQQTMLDEVLRHVRDLESEFQQSGRHDARRVEFDREAASVRRENDQRRDELENQAKELEQRLSALAHQEEALAQRERETELQRKHLARQMWAKKAELLGEVERARVELQSQATGQDMQLQLRFAEEQTRTQHLQAEVRRFEQQHEEARQLISDLRKDLERERNSVREQDSLRRQIDEERITLVAELEKQRSAALISTRDLDRLTAELARTREEMEHRVSELKALQSHDADEHTKSLQAQIDALKKERERLLAEQADQAGNDDKLRQVEDDLKIARRERTELTRRLHELEDQIEQGASAPAGGSTANTDELQRRLEMAMSDLRELKARNQDLASQLSKGTTAAVTALESADDWESQKRKLMAAWEQDCDVSIPQERANKMTVEGAIRITDQIVADRDREIEELRRLLEQQSGNIGNVAVGAAAIAQMFDQDELIVSERENLKEMQDRLQQQLRDAEVQISVERAKLGRERSDMEERLRAFEKEKAKLGITETAIPDKGKGSMRGQWLQRMGLNDGQGKK